MLDIPAAIMALYQTDGVRKNVRIHFPNGEMADLTNANIVRESLHFTESLCSQDVFRFGLAEASVIEFETVGVANMYGMTIEAGIEIDTSSLAAAVIAGIVADPGDGVIVEEQDSDIGYGFYRIPLGMFRVESCPRNHGAMTHRKVTAYTQGITDYEIMSPFEVWKQEVWWTLDSIVYPSFEALMDSNFAWYDASILGADYTKTQLTPGSGLAGLTLHKIIKINNKSLYIDASTGSPSDRVSAGVFFSPLYVDLLAGEIDDYDSTAARAWIASTLETFGISDHRAEVEKILGKFLHVYCDDGSNTAEEYTITENAPALCFPQRFTFANIVAIKQATLSLEYDGVTLTQAITNSAGSPFKAYRYRKNDTTNDHAASFSPSGTMDSGGTTYYSYAGSYSYRELFESWLELHGQFATEGRTGTIRRVTLDPTTPTAVVPGDYSEAWWDEYDVAPIGTVTVTYQAPGGGEATEQVIIGNGASVYDMQDNEVLKCLDISSVDDIADILTGDFADNAANVGFVPIDMTMQGWPWIEAGDALEITAEDGTTVDTYALRIEMQGIQHLEMTVTSQGGEIVGEA